MVSRKKAPISFASAVHKVVRGIRKGQVMSYAAVAAKAGFPKAARAVGTLMKHNYDPAIPCHRVVRSDGQLGQYNRGVKKKKELLTEEGVVIKNGRVVDLLGA